MANVSTAPRRNLRTAEPSRRERRKREVRERIIESAVALIDEKGFEATMVSAVCERADVAQKTFFNHFASKQYLLREVARVKTDDLLAEVESARNAGATAEERIERFFQILADRIEEAGPLRRELLTELVHLAHETGDGTIQARSLQGAFRALLREGAKSKVTGLAIDTFTEIVLGTFYALMFNWANLEGYPFRKRALAAGRFLASVFAAAKEGRMR